MYLSENNPETSKELDSTKINIETLCTEIEDVDSIKDDLLNKIDNFSER